jgi:hypothetical protein
MVLLWSALLMKKRVVVYSEKLTVLLRVIRALPLLVSYRQNWSILRPLVTLQGELEIADLKVFFAWVRARGLVLNLFPHAGERCLLCWLHRSGCAPARGSVRPLC